MLNDDMRNMPDHYPKRGDQVEAWMKDRRDQNKWDGDTRNPAWEALDDLLDEYRLAADTMMSLENVVNGVADEREDQSFRAKKPKVKR